MPKLFIISGCNGAGKTTASYTILPNMLNCGNFVNADEIARGLSPFNPEKAAIQAGRIMLARGLRSHLALFLAQHAFPGHRTGQTEGPVGRTQRKRGQHPPPV